MGTFVIMDNLKNGEITVSEFILLLHSGSMAFFSRPWWKVLFSATILLSLVIIVKLNMKIWTKLLTEGLKMAFSLMLGLHRE